MKPCDARSAAFAPLLAVACALAAGHGCSSFKDRFKLKPTVDLRSVRIKDMALTGATLVMGLGINNPNPVGVSLDQLKYTLNLNGKDLASGLLDQGVQLKANETTTVELPIHINYLDAFNSVSEMIHAGVTSYQLRGSMNAGSYEIPYDYSGKINLPVPGGRGGASSGG